MLPTEVDQQEQGNCKNLDRTLGCSRAHRKVGYSVLSGNLTAGDHG